MASRGIKNGAEHIGTAEKVSIPDAPFPSFYDQLSAKEKSNRRLLRNLGFIAIIPGLTLAAYLTSSSADAGKSKLEVIPTKNVPIQPNLPPTTTTIPETTTTLPKHATTISPPTSTTSSTTTTTIPIKTPPIAPVGPNKEGIDISWPNCSSAVTSILGMVGLNGGSNFTINPCLKAEAHNFSSQPWLYVNSEDPGPVALIAANRNAPNNCNLLDLNCDAYNYGFNAAVTDVTYAHYSDLDSIVYLIDVETENVWLGSPAEHRADLQGEINGLEAEHKLLYGTNIFIGEYSTTLQWNTITGGWQNNLPVWYATAQPTAAAAQPYCKIPSFSGGHIEAVQFESNGLDYDLYCN